MKETLWCAEAGRNQQLYQQLALDEPLKEGYRATITRQTSDY